MKEIRGKLEKGKFRKHFERLVDQKKERVDSMIREVKDDYNKSRFSDHRHFQQIEVFQCILLNY